MYKTVGTYYSFQMAVCCPGWIVRLSLLNVVCCQVQVSAMGRSLVQRSRTECVCVYVCVCVTKCDQMQQPTTLKMSKQKKFE